MPWSFSIAIKDMLSEAGRLGMSPAFPCSIGATFGKLLHLTGSPYPHTENGKNDKNLHPSIIIFMSFKKMTARISNVDLGISVVGGEGEFYMLSLSFL